MLVPTNGNGREAEKTDDGEGVGHGAMLILALCGAAVLFAISAGIVARVLYRLVMYGWGLFG